MEANRRSGDRSGPAPYGIAIIGTGGIAHAQVLSAFPDQARLAVAVDVEPDQAKAFAEHRQVPRTAASIPEALAPGDVDTVVSCTPPASHAPLAIEALAQARTS